MKPQEAKNELNNLKTALKDISLRLQLVGLTEMKARLKMRVFQLGQDVKGSLLSGYNVTYAKKRTKAGRQTGKKDLYFTGNLFQSIETGESGGNVVLGFTNEREAQIAKYQEEREGTIIFSPSEEEEEATFKVIEREIDAIFAENGL